MKKTNFKSIVIVATLLLSGYCLNAQDNPVLINIGAIKTTLKEKAIGIGIDYAKALNDILAENTPITSGDKWLFTVAPEINVITGNEDAFSSINAKVSGLFMVHHGDTTIAGIPTPNSARGFNTFPLSLGIESNNKFNIINGIAEIGWVPWYQVAADNGTPNWLKWTKFGVFLQGGYKFKLDTPGRVAIGGEIDESMEKKDHEIFRVKGSFGVDTKKLFEIGAVGVGLVGTADGWYDFLNSAIYYTVQGTVRLYLTENRDKFFDFKYQKGSGAPNFNEGDQYGMGLTVTF